MMTTKLKSEAVEVPSSPVPERQSRLEFTRLVLLIFIFVFVRGPLFRVEDLTGIGLNRNYVWKALNSLVKARVLEKFDRKSYGVTDDTRKYFRAALGGGVNDATLAYSMMEVETWSEGRLARFTAQLAEIWKERPERIKQDGARAGYSVSNERDDYARLEKLLFEKVEEASSIVATLERISKNVSENQSRA